MDEHHHLSWFFGSPVGPTGGPRYGFFSPGGFSQIRTFKCAAASYTQANFWVFLSVLSEKETGGG